MSKIYDAVLKEAKIRDIVSYYGSSIIGNRFVCPFHNDTNPSMIISDEKNIAKCFSCGEGGNPITYIMKYETKVNHNTDFTINDAVKKAVEICNLNIDVSHLKKVSENNKYINNGHRYTEDEKELLETTAFINKLATYHLKSQDNKYAKEYLIKRGFSDELIEQMQFGYIPNGSLTKMIDKRSETNRIRLEKTGLLNMNQEGNLYEVFHDRILIPIFDEKGNIVSFSGRSINGEEPKYLHGRSTEIFAKNDVLYNFHNAKNYAYQEELYIVEGFMDVAGGKKIGIDNIVATMGVSISEKQLQLIAKCNCDIVLMRDNDKAGREATLKEIPGLLKKNYRVHVIDWSKLNLSLPSGNAGKDLWDYANANLTKTQLEQAKVSAFEYYIEHYYFAEKQMSADEIHHVFVEARKDGLIKTTLDLANFKEYLIKHTAYQKEELDEIIFPKEIKEEPMAAFKQQLMKRYLIHGMERFIEDKEDKVLSGYYETYLNSQRAKWLETFEKEPTKYLSNDYTKMNCALLLYDVLHNDEVYEKYEYLHRFQYENVFDKTYIKNMNGEGKILLDDRQKEMVIKQFEASMSDNDKLALEEVEDLYIINDLKDLDGILFMQTDKQDLEMLKERLKQIMMLNPNKMTFFKYGNIFREEDKPAISNYFKSANGEYKTILFYNNLKGQLNLKKDNVYPIQTEKEKVLDDVMQQKKEPIQQRTQEQNRMAKELRIDGRDYIFSVHKGNILKANDNGCFVRIPGTKGKNYMFILKKDLKWSKNQELFFSSLKADKKYPIYDRNTKQIAEWSFNELKPYWEDKTKKREVPEIKDIKPTEKLAKYRERTNDFANDQSFMQHSVYRKEEQDIEKAQTSQFINNLPFHEATANEDSYVLSKARILQETSGGYYVETNQSNYSVYISKKFVEWNARHTHFKMENKKIFALRSPLSLYKRKENRFEFIKRMNFSDLSQYFQKRTEIQKVLTAFEISDVTYQDGFLKIPVMIEDVYGYVLASSANFVKISNEQIGIIGTENATFTFYRENGTVAKEVSSMEISDGYREAIEQRKTQEDIESLFEMDREEVEVL